MATKRMSTFILKKQPSMPQLEEIEEDIEDSEDSINARYEAILDKMLTTPQMKEQLMSSQSLEKKKQFIKLNKAHLDVGVWGDAEDLMLTQLAKAKLPDINSLSSLKQSLRSANKEYMNSFLEAGGISVLLTATENRTKKQPITELDVAILFEIVQCCKAVMNNAVGMDGFLSVEGSVNIIARSLNFEFKPYSLLVLEILSVCCYYSEKAASLVVEGMRQHAIHNKEATFSSLSSALMRQDIEMKAAVMQFVNNVIMGVADLNARSAVRNDLNCQLFGQNYDAALRCVETELVALREVEAHANEPHMKLKRKSMITIHGSKAYNEKKVESLMSKQSLVGVITDRGSIVGSNMEVRSNGNVMSVNPLQGTMAGLLIAAKNTEKIEAKIIDVFGGKKTKRRWFELDAEHFKWCAGHDKESEYKGSVAIGSIIEIRPHTNDHSVMESSSHAFEIETTERSYAFGCESAKDRDSWVTALETGRDRHMINKGSYLLQLRELTLRDVETFAEMFRKQGLVYHSISVEDKKQLIANNGLDLSNVHVVSSFLMSETLASGTNSKLLFILQELLLIPGGADGTWDAIVSGIKRVREANGRTPAAAGSSFLGSGSSVDALNTKAAESGGIYTQVSKLALTTFACEQELARLKAELRETEEKAEALIKEKSDLEAALISSKTQILKRPNDTYMLSHSESGGGSSSGGGNSASASSAAAVPSVVESAPLNPNYVPVVDSSVAALDERFAKYDKMRKLMPEGAVRQKMAADGYSEGQIELYFCGQTVPLVVPPPKPAKNAPSGANERFAKYDKMRKMLPDGAVRQKMAADGLTEAEMESYFNGTASAPVAAPAPAAPVAAATAAAAPPSLSTVFPTVAPPPIPGGAPPPVPSGGAVATDDRFAKFDKMRKMLPEGAVRQKMMSEGFTPDEIDAYFNGTLPTATTAAAPQPAAPAGAVDERFAKFEKMRKMLPEGAVRQKMMTEGFKPEEIEAFFNGTLPTAAPAAPVAVAPAALDERYVKYDKMRKMLPEGAVRQKMMQDGFTATEIDAFCADVIITAVTPASALPPPPAPVDPRFEKYDKMRKMLPEGAVRQKMMQDGFTAQEIESFFSGGGGGAAAGGAPSAAGGGGGISAAALAGGLKKPGVAAAAPAAPVVELPPEGMTAKPKVVPKHKLKGIFWTKIKPSEVPGTLWHKLKDFHLAAADTTRLEEWFASKISDAAAEKEREKKAKDAAAAVKLIAVLDGKRTQNALLIIGKIRKEPEGLVQMVIDLDPTVLNMEMTTSLFAILPTPEELTAIQTYHDPTILDLASKVLYHFNRVPRLQQRMECHEIAFNWFNTANGIDNQLGVILKAQEELVASQKSMEVILAMVLSIGNYINGDTARGQAYGVKLDIFMKMSNLKAALPSQGSLMHFLAIMAENHSSTADLVTINDKWMAIAGAAEVSLKQVNTDFMALEGQVNKMNTEFTRIKETKENVGLDGVLEDSKGKCTQPLHRRLEKFLKEAKPKVSALKELNKRVEEKVESVMNKYGESLKALSEEDTCKRFFTMISSFGRQFSAAVEDNRVVREAAEKAAKAAADAEKKLAAGPFAGAGGDKAATAGLAAAAAAAAKKKGPVENIFGNFHKTQAASSDDVLEEFKRKMMMRQQKQ